MTAEAEIYSSILVWDIQHSEFFPIAPLLIHPVSVPMPGLY